MLRQHLAAAIRSAGRRFAQAAFTLADSPVRGILQPGCDRAHGRRMLVTHRATAGMESVGRPGSEPAAPACSPAFDRCGSLPSSPSPRVPISRRPSRRRWPWPGRSCSSGLPPPPSPGGSAGRSLDASAELTTARDAVSAQAGAKDVGLLRDLRRPGRPLAATGQLSGASGRHGRAPHVADQHGACAAGESVRVRLRLHPGRAAHRAHGECAAHDGNAGTAPRAISTTGTTRRR